MSGLSSNIWNNTSSKPPSRPRRKDGLTHEEGAARQGQIVNEYYIDNNFQLKTPPSVPVHLKEPASKLRKGKTRAAQLSTNEQVASSAKMMKSASKRSSTTSDSGEPEATPSRCSERVKQKRRSVDDPDELESPLAKKPKKESVSKDESGRALDAPASKHHDSTSIWNPINGQLRNDKGHAEARKVKAKTEREAEKARTMAQADEASDAVITRKESQSQDDDGDKTEAVQPGESPKEKDKQKVMPAFKGTDSGMGTSNEKPDDAPNNVAWNCANRSCNTGQTWYDRDGGKAPFGRKSISQFFGRNKKETNAVHPDVWHNFCRKDYQREKYRADHDGPKGLSTWQIGHIRHQLKRIRLWRPEARFKVQLSEKMRKRTGVWFQAKRRNSNDLIKTQADFDKEFPKKLSKNGQEPKTKPPEEAFPIDLAEHFDRTFSGDDKSFEDIENLLLWLERELNADTIQQNPPMEFLIKDQQEGETVIDAKQNYALWAAAEDKMAAQGEEDDGDKVDDHEEDDDAVEKAETVQVSNSKATTDATEGVAYIFSGIKNSAIERAEGKTLFSVVDDAGESDDETGIEAETMDGEDVPIAPFPSPQRKCRLQFVGDPKTYVPMSSSYGARLGDGRHKSKGSDENEQTSAAASRKMMK